MDKLDMFKTMLLSIVLLGAFPIVAGCEMHEVVIANECVIVNAIQQEGYQLEPILDRLLEPAGFEKDDSDRTHLRYLLREDEIVIAEISCALGMGALGASLALFYYEKVDSPDLKAKFNSVVGEFVKAGHQVRDCKDVDGYRMPRIVR